jgi:Fe2+ or Zn2+ uptake regulation protein
METELSSTESVASKSERLQQVDLRATARRLLILEIIEALPAGEISAVVVLREAYDRGIYIPLPSLYRIIREFKRRGVLPQARLDTDPAGASSR